MAREAIVDPPTPHPERLPLGRCGACTTMCLLDDTEARRLLESCARTVRRKVASFDCGFWSLYEHSGTRLPELASPFYHGPPHFAALDHGAAS